MPNSASPFRKIVVTAVYHESHGRITRRTWAATLVMTDGTEKPCGHEGHRTTAAATECGQGMARRILNGK